MNNLESIGLRSKSIFVPDQNDHGFGVFQNQRGAMTPKPGQMTVE